MNLTAFTALVRRDLRLFTLDRKAVIMSIVAPILIASFFGFLFGGVADREPSRIIVAAIDLDQSEISQRLIKDMTADKALDVRPDSIEPARAAVRAGKITVAIVVPKGFGDQSGSALFRGQNKPTIDLMYDPSHSTELAMVRGILTQHVMEVVSRDAFSGAGGQRVTGEALSQVNSATGMNSADKDALRRMLESVGQWNRRVRANPQAAGVNGAGGGLSLPYAVKEESVTARKGVQYNAMAHSFAGMTVQFILMMGVDAGIIVITQRRSGIWKRLRAAPLSRFTIIAARATSAALIAMAIQFIVFGFARVVFHVRIEGSVPGFLGICAAFALMTAAFGLMIAATGKTPEATRGIAILFTLLLVMLGGAWVPSFIFPQWLQKVTFLVPTRWAVDGFDAMTWRGLGFDAAVPPIAAMLGFTLLFGALALWRFRWEAE
jgi:ABC-2 type transport system permease protein